MRILNVPELRGRINQESMDELTKLDKKLEELRIILADAALVETAEEKQYQILEALRILGVEFRSAAVEPGRKPIPNPESGLRRLW